MFSNCLGSLYVYLVVGDSLDRYVYGKGNFPWFTGNFFSRKSSFRAGRKLTNEFCVREAYFLIVFHLQCLVGKYFGYDVPKMKATTICFL